MDPDEAYAVHARKRRRKDAARLREAAALLRVPCYEDDADAQLAELAEALDDLAGDWEAD